jgi:thioredoxin-dependent peroxiredoxin
MQINLETQISDKTQLINKLGDISKTPKTLLYFYPKDNTPGCSNQATELNAVRQDFAKLGITIVGCSPDSIASHQKFIGKYNLEFALISDPEKTLIQKMGAWGEKKNYGKAYIGLIRSSFLLDTQTGEVLKEWRNVRAKGHAAKLLKEI